MDPLAFDNVPPDSDVFEDFVDGMAQVGVTISVRGTVVEHVHTFRILL